MATYITYDKARADHEYLWNTYGPAYDMTGGYVDQKDLDRLLRSPKKSTARDCYIDQIRYWFQRGPELDVNDDWLSDPKVLDISLWYISDEEIDKIHWKGEAAAELQSLNEED